MFLAAQHRALTLVETFFVISGCSGLGKSTLLGALAAAGERVVPEPGRRVVRAALERGGDGLPWANLLRFSALCAARAAEDFDRHLDSRARVFERSPLDQVAGLGRAGLPLPYRVRELVSSRRYAPPVFLPASWRALFHTDEDRRHSCDGAVAEYVTLEPTYGYEAAFLSTLAAWGKP